MSEGLICLKCRLYINPTDPEWACKCEEPEPSENIPKPANPTGGAIFSNIEIEQMLRWFRHAEHSLSYRLNELDYRVALRLTSIRSKRNDH